MNLFRSQTRDNSFPPLKAYFGSIPVLRISPDLVREYVIRRKNDGVANKTVNLEIGVIRGVLKRAKRWYLFADEIKPLPARHQVGRALSAEEKLRLTEAASEKPEWQNARLAMTLALNTTMRASEIKGLHWRDVNFPRAYSYSPREQNRRRTEGHSSKWRGLGCGPGALRASQDHWRSRGAVLCISSLREQPD
jgi:integrase